MDLLAVRLTPVAGWECRHVEVQASIRPVSYLTKLPKDVAKESGRARGSAKQRTEAELRAAVREWIRTKYDHPVKKKTLLKLAPGPWSRELVVHEVKFPEEVDIIGESGLTVRRLADVLHELKRKTLLDGAAGSNLTDLVALSTGAE